MRRSFWITLLLVCAGVVVGSLVAEVTAGTPVLKYLSYGLDFGTAAPVTVDLHVLIVTFGITVKITVAHILFVTAAILLGWNLYKYGFGGGVRGRIWKLRLGFWRMFWFSPMGVPCGGVIR